MPKNHLDKAIEVVPKFGDRISLFTKKLRLAQYADSTIYNYRLKISQAALYLKKLPDKFTQEDIDDYLTMLLDRNSYSISHFKHTIFGLKDYYKYMDLKEPGGLVLPRVRKSKRLPRVLSQEQTKRLIGLCEIYDKALLSTIYDCALRVSEACSLKWERKMTSSLNRLSANSALPKIGSYTQNLLQRESTRFSSTSGDMPLGLPSAIPGYKTSLMILFPTTTRITEVAESMVS